LVQAGEDLHAGQVLREAVGVEPGRIEPVVGDDDTRNVRPSRRRHTVPDGMPEREYIIDLGISDRLRIRILTDHARVMDFVVQYETRNVGTFQLVVRFDYSHGFAYRDVLDRGGALRSKDALPEHMDLKEALGYAERD
jgi:hypothetical protein